MLERLIHECKLAESRLHESAKHMLALNVDRALVALVVETLKVPKCAVRTGDNLTYGIAQEIRAIQLLLAAETALPKVSYRHFSFKAPVCNLQVPENECRVRACPSCAM
jgi:hypothetical protein